MGVFRVLFLTCALALVSVSAAPCSGADLAEIVRRGTAAIRSDWAADPDYAYIERDEMQKGDKVTSRTSQVVMLEGSDYYRLIAVDDQPLPADRQEKELQNLRNEFRRRKSESQSDRNARIARYRKQRDENGELLLNFPTAFSFEYLRDEMIDGHDAFVLAATALKRSGPLSRAAKVLSGMRGAVWVDKDQFHAIRVDCTVVSPVPIFGILARVLPGTHIELRMAPVSDTVWLITDFSMSLTVSKFFFTSTQYTHSTYSDYRLNTEVLQELMLADSTEPERRPDVR